MPNNFFQNIKNAASTALSAVGITINDDRGNALNVPINQQKPKGIYRTFLPSGNVSNVMVKVDKNSNDNNPPGFTPEEFYYVKGTQSLSDTSGFATEQGNVQSNVSLKNNTSLNKISRTNLEWNPGNASPLGGQRGSNQIFLNNNTVAGSDTVGQGFTNPLYYITDDTPNDIRGLTGVPKQFGDTPNNIKPNFNKNSPIYTTPDVKVKESSKIFHDFYNDTQFEFVHNLDRKIPHNGSKNAYLGSFLKTSSNNEDPTMYGYDIYIKYDSSPLFNGSINNFIDKFSDNIEIQSRRDVWLAFCNQFFNFFKIDPGWTSELSKYNSANYGNQSPSSNGETQQQTGDLSGVRYQSDITPAFNDLNEAVVSNKHPKAYYLKKISGLENLVEKDVSVNSDTIKSMIDYGKDIIKLSLYEDVSVNMGYLAMLYKTLSWSRLNGKNIIPENLLRFDAYIEITEIRDYNRVIKDFSNNNLDVLPDVLSKYTYTLYDCQFMFNEIPHGGEIDMSAPKMVDEFGISFNYKYSTMAIDKFMITGKTQSHTNRFTINNENDDPINITINDKVTGYFDESKERYDYYPLNLPKRDATPNNQIDRQKKAAQDLEAAQAGGKWDKYIASEEPTLEKAKRNDLNRKLMEQLGKKLKKAAANEINRQITTQAKLLNRTLDNIRNSIGIGRMSEPTNVYKTNQLKNDVQNAFREFVGNSVRGFFTP